MNIKSIVDTLNASVEYVDLFDKTHTTPKLFEMTMPKETEMVSNKTMEEIKNEHLIASKLSTRNHRDTYIIPIEKDKVYLNLLPTKRFVMDNDLQYILETEFEYFLEEPPTAQELPQFVLEDGTIYRVSGNGVKQMEDYEYFVIVDGQVERIPNFKTVEVMLAERGQIIDAVRVVTPGQHEDLLMNSDIVELEKTGIPTGEAEMMISRGEGRLSGTV